MSYTAQLAQQAAEYDAAVVEQPEGGDWVPAFSIGKRQTAKIVAARVGAPPWPDDKRLYLMVELANDKGHTDDTYIQLTELTGGSVAFTKKQLIGLGFTGSIADIEAATEGMIGATVKMNVDMTKGDKPRLAYYFNGIDESVVDDDDFTF